MDAMSSMAPPKACWLGRAGVPTDPASRPPGPPVTSTRIFMASACASEAEPTLGGIPSFRGGRSPGFLVSPHWHPGAPGPRAEAQMQFRIDHANPPPPPARRRHPAHPSPVPPITGASPLPRPSPACWPTTETHRVRWEGLAASLAGWSEWPIRSRCGRRRRRTRHRSRNWPWPTPESDDLGDLIRLCRSAQQGGRAEGLGAIGRCGGVRRVLGDGIDTNTTWAELSGPRSRQRRQRGFRGAVGGATCRDLSGRPCSRR